MASMFPALHGQQGDTEYIITKMRLAEVNRFINYAESDPDWADMKAELRAQRKLKIERVREEMVPYLTDNPDHFFSALTVELEKLDLDTDATLPFQPSESNKDVGMLVLEGTEKMHCTDGQHRLKAIELAVKEDSSLGVETIAVIVMPYQGVVRSQTRFSDLNRYAKQPTKTQNILYSHRDVAATIAKRASAASKYYGPKRLNTESNTLSKGSPQVITLGVLYECVKTLLGKVPENMSEEEQSVYVTAKSQEIAHLYDDVVFPALSAQAPEITAVYGGKEPAHTLRKNYIFAHSIGQQAIAIAVKAAEVQRPDEWKTIVSSGFSKINWEIGLPWEGIATIGGKMANRRQNIQRTAALIKAYLGLELIDSEKHDLVTAKQQTMSERGWHIPASLVA